MTVFLFGTYSSDDSSMLEAEDAWDGDDADCEAADADASALCLEAASAFAIALLREYKAAVEAAAAEDASPELAWEVNERDSDDPKSEEDLPDEEEERDDDPLVENALLVDAIVKSKSRDDDLISFCVFQCSKKTQTTGRERERERKLVNGKHFN